MILFLIGLFCFLLVAGFFIVGDDAIAFAFGSMIFLGALAFIGFVGFVLYAILSSQ